MRPDCSMEDLVTEIVAMGWDGWDGWDEWDGWNGWDGWDSITGIG